MKPHPLSYQRPSTRAPSDDHLLHLAQTAGGSALLLLGLLCCAALVLHSRDR